MEHQPPPFFRTGPTPLARLLTFSALSVALLVSDSLLGLLAPLRQAAAVIVYPLQRLALAPATIASRVGEFFVTQSALQSENARLAAQNRAQAAQLAQLTALQTENARLRELMGARQRMELNVLATEILYAARDPFSRRVVVDKGREHGVEAGLAVVDDRGVVGQVTRVYPWLSEVTLVTDKGQFIPVENQRNGLRAVLSGTGSEGALELRFIPLNADFQMGDRLATSGIDGVYPPGLPVAEVAHVERSAAQLFARIICKPLAGVASHRHLLIVLGRPEVPPRPAEEPKAPRPRKGRKG